MTLALYTWCKNKELELSYKQKPLNTQLFPTPGKTYNSFVQYLNILH